MSAVSFLSNVGFYGQDLTKIAGLSEAVASYLEDIRTFEMRKTIEKNF